MRTVQWPGCGPRARVPRPTRPQPPRALPKSKAPAQKRGRGFPHHLGSLASLARLRRRLAPARAPAPARAGLRPSPLPGPLPKPGASLPKQKQSAPPQ